MPLFRRVDPGLRPLIAYIVARAVDRGITLNRTKLVKLLYLIDVERVRSRREPLTGLEWVFFHYGPYAFELIDALQAMEGAEVSAMPFGESVLYRAAPGAPDATDWPAGTKSMVDSIIDRFAPLELNELLDHVYFHTGPMIDAERGQRLDLSKARADRDLRLHRPLPPPDAPAGVDDRLAAWRSRNAERLAAVRLDPPGRFIEDEEDQSAPEQTLSGRLRVRPDGEL
jgi:hypothetical protein